MELRQAAREASDCQLEAARRFAFSDLLSGEQRQPKMKLLKRIWRVMFPSHPLPCSHKWKRDGELYVKCEKCGELAVYIGGQR